MPQPHFKPFQRLLPWLPLALLIPSLLLNQRLYQTSLTYYQQLNQTRLDPLGLRAYPSVAPLEARSPLIVFYGDSRAEAWTPPPNRNPKRFLNRGIHAQTTSQILARYPHHIAPLRPHTLILQLGGNDLKTIPLFPDQRQQIIQTCQTNIQTLIQQALANGTQRIILTTIFPTGPVPLDRRPVWSDDVDTATAEVNVFLKSLSDRPEFKGKVQILDTVPLLAGSDGLTRSEYRQDFLHLNPTGYAALNQALSPLLRQDGR